MIAIFSLTVVMFPEITSATKMKSHWRNPEANEASLKFEKVIVIVTVRQDLTRKVAEDKVVRILEAGGTPAVASYTILSVDELENKVAAKARVEQMGFDGAIVIRYAGSEGQKRHKQEEDWHEYNYFWGAYYPATGAVFNATETDSTKVFVETMLWSLRDQKLIFSGTTETKNPKNAAVVVGEIAEETSKYLQKEGLIQKKK